MNLLPRVDAAIADLFGGALQSGRDRSVMGIFLVAMLLGVATPYSYFHNPERGLFVLVLVVILFLTLFSVLGSAEHELDKFGIEEAVLGRSSLVGHQGSISAVDVSSGPHQRIVSGSYDSTVRVWSLQSGEHEVTYSGHSGAVFALAITRAGTVVSGGIDRTIQVWNLDTGLRVLTLTGHMGSILSLQIVEPVSAYGEVVVISGGDDGVCKVWSLQSATCLRTLRLPDPPLGGATMSTLALSTGSDPIIVAGSSTGKIYMWRLHSGAYLGSLDGHFGAVLCVAVSPSVSCPLVVSCSVDWTVRVWDLLSSRSIRTLQGHSGVVGSVAICGGADEGDMAYLRSLPNDGAWARNSMHLIVSGGRDSTVRVWDLFTGELYVTLEDHTDSVCAVAISMSVFPPWGYRTSEQSGLRSSASAIELSGGGDFQRKSRASRVNIEQKDREELSHISTGVMQRRRAGTSPGGSIGDNAITVPSTCRYSSAKKSCALIITGGVDSAIKVWDLEKIKRDVKWGKRRTWAVFVSVCRREVSQCSGISSRSRNNSVAAGSVTPTAAALSAIDSIVAVSDVMRSTEPNLLAMVDLPGFQKFIYVDDLCGEVGKFL